MARRSNASFPVRTNGLSVAPHLNENYVVALDAWHTAGIGSHSFPAQQFL